MKTLTADELRAHALRTGAEVIIDGRPFNTARAQIQAPAKPLVKPAPVPIAPPIPAPITPEPSFSRAEVERLLADQEQRLQAQIQTMVAMLKAAERPARPRITAVVPVYDYDKHGAITKVNFQYNP